MRCSACSTENPPQAKFCLECGAPQARSCASCGAELPGTARFCMECGQPVAGVAPAAVPTAAPPVMVSPQAYTPKHLAEKILASRAGLEGERKQVTVLFADVVGSTELIQGRDAEEAQQLLDGVVKLMMDAVHRYEGTVSRLMGDGLMALFGAPLAHEDHAVRACYAALAMQAAVRQHTEELRRLHGITLTIRAGLSAGEVVVRTIRDDLHMDYTAMGQTVHLASRIEQLAEPGSSTLTAETLALVEGYVQVRSLGPVPVKGLPEPIEIYKLLGAGQARTRLQAAAMRGLTRFVGRDVEMGSLYAALARAEAGQGQVAALVGEPGVGKSRLVWEVTHSHRIQDWLVLESGSVSHGKATPWLPVIDLLKTYCRIEPRDDVRAVREKVIGKLLALDEELRDLAPALLALLDQPVDDPSWVTLDASQRRRRTLDGIKRLLLRESQVQPLLLVFEDLHWLDSETQALLDSLVDGLPAARVLLLMNYRPEYRHEWGSKTYYSQVRVDPLAAEGVQELLALLMGNDPSLGSLFPMLLSRTAGNPFFVEESVRTLIETSALVGERGAYRLAHPVDAVRVPATVQAMLAARIDRLSPEDKRLLQTASVVGKDIPYTLLLTVADLPEDALRAGLAQLQAAEFVYETALFPELEYTFKHALTHEVAYSSLLQERRKALHGQLVDAIERLFAGRLVEHVDRLTDHALRAERWEQGAVYARQAGARAAERMAYVEAVHRFEQALLALGHLPERRDVLERAVDTRLDLRPVLMALNESPRMFDLLREAEILAAQLDDVRRLAQTRVLMVRNLEILGNYDAAIEVGRQAEASGDTLDDPTIWIPAAYLLTDSFTARGEHREAIARCEKVMAATEGEAERRRFGLVTIPGLAIRAKYALSLASVGETSLAMAAVTEAVRAAEHADHLNTLSGVLDTSVDSYIILGRADLAMTTIERIKSISKQLGDSYYPSQTEQRFGATYGLAGHYAEALSVLEPGVEREITAGQFGRAVRLLVPLSDVYLQLERLDDAELQARRLLDLARSCNLPRYTADALLLLGKIGTHRTPPDSMEAEMHYHEALGLAEELEMRPLQAHCHLGLGKLYRRIKKLDEARAELSIAVRMLTDMELAHWLPEAEAELALVTVPPAAEPVT
jgi:class 3 adenylate cyclase/tetratricopeptide (TPR) repeat protein